MTPPRISDLFWIGGATLWDGTPAQGPRALVLASDGTAELCDPIPSADNPMFAVQPSANSLAISHEIQGGLLSLYRIESAPASAPILSFVGSAPTGGADPTHIAASPDGQAILAANYSGGSLSVTKISGGQLNPAHYLVQYEGTGPDKERQSSSHPHQVVFSLNGGLVYVPDLGTDSIHVHNLVDLLAARPNHRNIRVAPGAGPRHLVATDRHLIVACELDSTVRVFSSDSGQQITWARPTVSNHPSFPSTIRLTQSGHVLVGNRGPDTIGVLKWDEEAESLIYLNESPCGGQHPRDFELSSDEQYLVVANLNSDQVSILRFDRSAAELHPVTTLDTPSPTCAVRFEAISERPPHHVA